MGPYRSLWVLMGSYRSLCVFMDSKVSLCVLSGLSVVFTESPYLWICAKNYGYAYKKYMYRYKILILVGLFYVAFYRTCVYTHAYFRIRFFYA